MSDADRNTAYTPEDIEERWYARWLQAGCFETAVNPDRQPHTIMMPPPNVTGRLHMGHALQSTVQDALTRIRRMQGREALWLPGKDHAGIATQNVVEKQLKSESGIDRHALGREQFVDRVWEWKEEYGDIISTQMRKLGVSCDWSRERFTMDDGFTRAVQTVFVSLYEQGLIYRGNYLVNWCPVDHTALSDEEVDNVEQDGSLWYVRYPLADGDGFITVATTRPETMLGDTAIAVNPDDDRYSNLVGTNVTLPLVGRKIPIIADHYVKKEFGAGALKVTPGHDKNDFDIGRSHGLDVISIMNLDGTLNENAGPDFVGMDRFDARKAVVARLEGEGLIDKIEPYKVSVPISSRSKAVIEPLLSLQWFVKMKPLAEPALEAVRSGSVKFFPQRWENEYFRWLENIRDWTISRQLWWGHRIPVWYYTDADGNPDEKRDFVVSVDQPEPGMVQDEDVLDTWFSSWLWPFATLGWPEQTKELAYFYPTSVLVSGYDILFFWIARMIMAGIHFTGQPPYSDIFITGMVKDKLGRWMSKSLGNGIDPLDMISEYGADAVRYSLTVLCAQGQDIKLDPTKFQMGRNFANKIWNAFNVFGQHMQPGVDYRRSRDYDQLELVERWILDRLNNTIESVDESVSRYRLNEALLSVYDLFWRDYCDWYLELIKPDYGEEMKAETIALAVEVYEKMLRLLHPFMPFITEELYARLRDRSEAEYCMSSSWPESNRAECSPDDAGSFSLIQSLVSGIRNVRSEYNVPAGMYIGALATVPAGASDRRSMLLKNQRYLMRLARLDKLDVSVGATRPRGSASVIEGDTQLFVPLADVIDLDVERARIRKEIDNKSTFAQSVARKLQNKNFVDKAPADVVQKERDKQQYAHIELERLKQTLAAIEG